MCVRKYLLVSSKFRRKLAILDLRSRLSISNCFSPIPFTLPPACLSKCVHIFVSRGNWYWHCASSTCMFQSIKQVLQFDIGILTFNVQYVQNKAYMHGSIHIADPAIQCKLILAMYGDIDIEQPSPELLNTWCNSCNSAKVVACTSVPKRDPRCGSNKE